MTMSANIHDATTVTAKAAQGTAWLHIGNDKGDHIAVFMPLDRAIAIQDAWAASSVEQKVAVE